MQNPYDTFGDFQSSWCRQEDVDPSVVETISAAEMVEFTQQDQSVKRKVVLHFRGGLKPLPLGPTNRDKLMELFDLSSKSKLDAVVGEKIRIYRDASVTMGGKKVGGIRICSPDEDPTQKARRPKKPVQPHPAEAGEDDDSVESLQSDWPEERE